MSLRHRNPGTGCKCTRCGTKGDHKFGRTAYGTLNSWCVVCHTEWIREAWRKQKMTTKPRKGFKERALLKGQRHP